ncbi:MULTISPECIES: SusC/RagA family TonB-linked outer membrane protein [Hymenobacter]|uniref:SusC/RagA family TonB-linked outer membrane protein n=1 Tax=Hymenobacter TaxID=89966 RepID=UPI001F399C3F|nr:MULTISPECIES: SusC/RagA family TonB-linked outer membrane protein [unclassified Hymenobacter]
MVFLLSCLWHQASAQDRNLSGRVTDRSTGQGLPGVTVLAKGTTIGTSTNSDGAFALSVPASVTTLTFSFIGYTTLEQPIGSGTNINVALATDSKQLGEVVVTGALGLQRQEREIGYATATLDNKEVTQARPTNFVSGLAGKVSGLQIQTLNNGVNSTPRVTLRGTRSLLGNNEALIVIDGVITTNEVLGALNPDDIASTTVLKGANAAALYGSQASNGALIITTKKGQAGSSQVTFSHTSQFESISFLPKFQTEFGPGSPDWYTNSAQAKQGIFFDPSGNPDNDYNYQYQGFENQQYGPRFDGSIQPFGYKLPDGSVQKLSYEARPNEKKNFFNTGYQMQNGVTFSGGDEKTKFFASYQNVHNNGIVPKDVFDRNSFRFNASREIGRLTVGFNVSYITRKSDVTSNLDQSSSVYWNVFNTSVMAPLTSYKDYVNNPYATSDYGYYNAYYYNPYFIIDYNRLRDKRSTLQGDVNASFRVRDWLRLQYRLGTTSTNQQSYTTQNKFTLASNSLKQISPYPGFYRDLSSNLTRINSDLFLSADKTFGDFNIKAILGNNIQTLQSGYTYTASTALAVPAATELINLSNRIGNLDGASQRFQTRLYAFYADLTLGYKDFFFLHGSARNDNVSVLAVGNNSFVYPSVDASLVFSNVIPALRDASFLDYGKIRGGIAKVSQINLPSATGIGVVETGGAYSLASTYSNGGGFPFGSVPSFTANGGLVQQNLVPEETRSTEAGIELSFLKRAVGISATYYNQRSTNQTIPTTIPYSTGFQTLLLNAGEVKNTGYEVDLNLTPIRAQNGLTVTVGANFNYNNNEVVSLPAASGGILTLGGSGSTDATSLVAVPGMSYPQIQGTFYQRVNDPTSPANGMIKMTKVTDPNDPTLVRYVPLKDPGLKLFGNTQPKYKYGFNTNISFKGITLSAQAELRTGYVVYNAIGSDLDFTGGGVRSAQYGRADFPYPNSAIPVTDASGNVTGYTPNAGADPVLTNGHISSYTPRTGGVLTPGGSEFWANTTTWNRGITENYVTSGTFFKIRQVQLSYAIPTALASKVGLIKGASIEVFGRNIFTWVPKENIYTDPEFSGTSAGSNAIGINTFLQTPPTKFYGASLNVTL